MATWGLHLRIAEEILDRGYDLDPVKFIVGNIGPDCGVPNEDRTKFDPPAEVTHWSDKGKKYIYPDRFFDAYLAEKVGDKEKRSFYIGYYTHLFVDKEWRKFIERKKKSDPAYASLKEDKSLIRIIKKDWYCLDHLYMRDNPDNIFFRIFQYIDEFPNYLHYYERGAIMNQVRFITDFYLNPPKNLDRKYTYLSLKEMDDFVDRTVFYIDELLEQKQLVYAPAFA
ncbi:MAG: zinc dependent phospholipase C family protein [Spirochaetales bacterium]|nr:zinc dependent phospholipase C family protein [Spirochaetales bacterium]